MKLTRLLENLNDGEILIIDSKLKLVFTELKKFSANQVFLVHDDVVQGVTLNSQVYIPMSGAIRIDSTADGNVYHARFVTNKKYKKSTIPNVLEY